MNRKRRIQTAWLPLIALAAGIIPALAAAAPADFVTGLVTAKGMGIADGERFPMEVQARMMSRRAALVDAQRNLLEITNGVRITSGTTVENMMVTSDKVGTRVKGVLEGAFIVDEKTYEDSGSWVSEVELALCVNKRAPQCAKAPTLMEALREAVLKEASPAPSYTPASAPASQAAADAATTSDANAEDTSPVANDAPRQSSNAVTGLIVDVRAHDFTPMLDVRIRTQSGEELYGPAMVNPGEDWLNWARSIESAVGMTDIIGESPMLIPASGLDQKDYVIVSPEHAQRIFRSNENGGDFLRGGNVVFVVR